MYRYQNYSGQPTIPFLPENAGRRYKRFRTVNPIQIAQYYGNPSQRDVPTTLELIIYEYKFGFNQIYIKFPHEEHFVEIFGTGKGSRGSYCSYSAKNVLLQQLSPREDYDDKTLIRAEHFKIYHNDEHAMINFDGSMDFVFLERIDLPITSEQFIALPEYRRVVYACRIDNTHQYIIVDRSEYGPGYDKRGFYGHPRTGFKEGKISDEVVYRDGGTTYFDFEVDGVTHKFFYPTKLGGMKEPATLDNMVMTDLPEDLTELCCNILKINRIPKESKKD